MPKKLFTLLVCSASVLLCGCQTADSVLADAKELQIKAAAVLTDVKTGVGNVVAEVENAKDKLLQKKAELEEAIANIKTTVDSINRLLGKDSAEKDSAEIKDLETQKAELEKTIAELQTALTQADQALADPKTTENKAAN